MIIPCHTPSEKNRLFQQSKKNLIADLDLYNILRRLQDFDKIKNLLFSKDQIKILNFSPKPNVSVICDVDEKTIVSKKSFQRINTTRFINDGIEYDSMHIFEDLISSWKKLKNDFQNNKISQDLAKLFGQQFESSFDGFDDFLHEKQQGVKDDREENASDLMEIGSVKNEINSIEQFVNVKGGTYLCDEN